MLNVEQDLRENKIKSPGVGLHDPSNDDIEAIPFVHLTLTDALRVKNKAQKAYVQFLADAEMDSAEYFADVEYNNTLKYWAVVYCLSVDDEAAYKRNGLEQVESYVENFLGVKYFNAFESLALEICEECGLELRDLDTDEEDEDETENVSVTAY